MKVPYVENAPFRRGKIRSLRAPIVLNFQGQGTTICHQPCGVKQKHGLCGCTQESSKTNTVSNLEMEFISSQMLNKVMVGCVVDIPLMQMLLDVNTQTLALLPVKPL